MTPERWKRVEELFTHALTLPGDEWEVFVGRECSGDEELRREVLALLASDRQAQGSLEKRVERGVVSFHAGRSEAIRQAGPYRLTKELGRGGMGTVYLGERADGEYRGEVAVKVVRPGMDTGLFLERFKRERQALARLQHPNIARLLDSGAAEDGSPYIVMELVIGRPIHVYCREEELSIPGILRLYLSVCHAVAHAHQQFVVHRDIKPGNILVTAAGVPKLLDFGICKLLENEAPGEETMTGAHWLTPDYASPEQIRGHPITAASDVYALGVVLYELLTGRLPHGAGNRASHEVARIICEEGTIRPSAAVAGNQALARQLAGDLDVILLRALQKEASRRYASVEQLGEDLRRFLDNEPVLARPDTAMYRAGKFVRRHRGGVAAAATVTLALAGGLLAYAHQASIARRQSAEARRLANAMIFEIHGRIETLPGALAAREAIVKIGLDYLDRMAAEASTDQGLRLELAGAYLRIGQVQGDILEAHTGDTDGALVSYRKGLTALDPLPLTRETGFLRMSLHHKISTVLTSRDPVQALEAMNRSVGIAVALNRQHPADLEIQERLADMLVNRSLILRAAGQRERALADTRRAIEFFTGLLKEQAVRPRTRVMLATALSAAGTLQASLNQQRDARESLRQSIAHWEEICRQGPNNTTHQRNRMLVYSHLGDLLGNPAYPNLGDTAGAIAAFRSMLSVAEEQHRASPRNQTAAVDHGMAMARFAGLPLGTPAERLSMYQKAAALLEGALRKDPANNNIRANLAAQAILAGDLWMDIDRGRAREQYLRGLAILDARPGSLLAMRRIATRVRQKLGEEAAGRRAEAEALSYGQAAVSIAEQTAREGDSFEHRLLPGRAYAAMGTIRTLLGKEDGRVWLERAAQIYRSLESEPQFSAPEKSELRRLEAALAGR